MANLSTTPSNKIDEGVLLGYAQDGSVNPRGLQLGPGARVRSGSIIYANTTIGKNLETGHNTTIRERNTIGDDTCIWNNTTIDYGCIIGSRVKIHCNVYIPQFTTIGDDVFIAPGCTFANDMYPGCPASRENMKGPTIGRGAQIGVNVTILPHISIGEYSMIGSGSVVTSDVPPKSVAWGNPVRVQKTTNELACCNDDPNCIRTNLQH